MSGKARRPWTHAELHDEHKSGGNQPANISMINRRYLSRTIP